MSWLKLSTVFSAVHYVIITITKLYCSIFVHTNKTDYVFSYLTYSNVQWNLIGSSGKKIWAQLQFFFLRSGTRNFNTDILWCFTAVVPVSKTWYCRLWFRIYTVRERCIWLGRTSYWPEPGFRPAVNPPSPSFLPWVRWPDPTRLTSFWLSSCTS